MSGKHFVIVSPAYCGARLIRNTLNRHPNIRVFDASESISRLLAYSHDGDKQGEFEDVDAIGYVLNLDKHPLEKSKELWQRIESDPDLRIIVLHRENLLEYVLLAKTNGGSDTAVNDDFKTGELVQAFERFDKAYQELCEFFQDFSAIHITYERLVGDWDACITQLQQFLAVEVFEINIESKISRFPLNLQLIDAALALRKEFWGSPWEGFFELLPQAEDPGLNPVASLLEADPLPVAIPGKFLRPHWVEERLTVNAMHPSNQFTIGKNCHWNGAINIHGRNNVVIIGDDFAATRRFFIQIAGDNNRITIGDDVTVHKHTRFLMSGHGNSLHVSDLCTGEFRINFEAHDSHVVFGKHVTAGACNLGLKEPSKITFGEDCMMAIDIQLATSDMHGIYKRGTGERLNHAADIVIGDHVWLGKSVNVLKGTTIGSGSVIGADSVVRGEIPGNCVAVGAPAKVVKEDILWTREIHAALSDDFFERWEY